MMKNFIVGLLTGFVFFILYILFFSNLSTTPPSNQTHSKQVSKKSVSKEPKNLINSGAESDKNKSIILSIKESLISKKKKENAHTIPTKQNEPNAKREELMELAMKISDDELEKAILSLNRALKPEPALVFFKEVRDESNSLLRESELEQQYYEHQPYNGLAKIQSVECRVTLCKLSLSYPSGAAFNKKQLSKFSKNIEITHIGKKDKSNQVKVIIYIAIKD